MKQTSKTLTYMRFLNLIGAVLDDPTVPNLDSLERELLNLIAQRWAGGDEMTVLEAMKSGVSGMSPSTVHRRIKRLVAAGMIKLRIDDHDNRIKYLTPTPAALALFDRMGDCVLQSGFTPDP